MTLNSADRFDSSYTLYVLTLHAKRMTKQDLIWEKEHRR